MVIPEGGLVISEGHRLREGLAFGEAHEKWKIFSCVRLFETPWTMQAMEFSPGHNTGVGSCSILQGIFPTQGLNPSLPH